MPTKTLGKVVRHMHRLLGSPVYLADAHLLDRFVKERDQAAFTLLVQRHGPRILGVCRRILGNHHDAEDAFQATFFVLACRARSIAKREALGSWLHGVAHRIALQLRSRNARRREHLQNTDDLPSSRPCCPLEEHDFRALLDDELTRLPGKYRSAILLHHLQGRSIEEAASQLGWTEGQFRSAVYRARRLLENRLRRRGLGVSTGLFGSILADSAVSAALADATVAASFLFATNKSATTGSVPAAAAALAQGALQTMFVSKLKLAVVFLVTVGVIGLGLGRVGLRALDDSHMADRPFELGDAQAVKGFEAQLDKRSDRERVQGTWIRSIPPNGVEVFCFDDNEVFSWFSDADGAEKRLLCSYAYKLDMLQRPKRMDLYPADERKTRQRSFVYELKDDKLILVSHLNGSLVFKRQTPQKDAADPASKKTSLTLATYTVPANKANVLKDFFSSRVTAMGGGVHPTMGIAEITIIAPLDLQQAIGQFLTICSAAMVHQQKERNDDDIEAVRVVRSLYKLPKPVAKEWLQLIQEMRPPWPLMQVDEQDGGLVIITTPVAQKAIGQLIALLANQATQPVK